MADLYEVILYDDLGARQAILQGWEYLEFTQRLNAPWNHNLRFHLRHTINNNKLLDLLQNQIAEDWIIRVKRTDALTGVKDTVYEGLNRTVVTQAKDRGSLLINLYGSGYTELLTRRVVVPASGTESSDKTGPAETIIKAYVDEQAINPVDPDRIIVGLANEPNAGTGNPVTYSARYTNLLSVISKLAEDGGIDFGIIGGSIVGEFNLRVVPEWGLDKTVVNGVGRNPVVFDDNAGNMGIPIHSRNASEERNFVYVGGSGEGINREIYTLGWGGISNSINNRREAFVDARREKTTEGLRLDAIEYLRKYEARDTLTFNVLQTPSVRWLTHWGLGDTITSRFYGQEWHQKIEEVTVRVSGGGRGSTGAHEYISAEMRIVNMPWLLGVPGRSELDFTTILG